MLYIKATWPTGLGGFSLKTTDGVVSVFGNQGENLEMTHGVIEELVFRQSDFMKGLWPSNAWKSSRTISILVVKWFMSNNPTNRSGCPRQPSFHPLAIFHRISQELHVLERLLG